MPDCFLSGMFCVCQQSTEWLSNSHFQWGTTKFAIILSCFPTCFSCVCLTCSNQISEALNTLDTAKCSVILWHFMLRGRVEIPLKRRHKMWTVNFARAIKRYWCRFLLFLKGDHTHSSCKCITFLSRTALTHFDTIWGTLLHVILEAYFYYSVASSSIKCRKKIKIFK